MAVERRLHPDFYNRPETPVVPDFFVENLGGKKVVPIFPGQGIQSSGMGEELYKNNPRAKRLFEKASIVVGFSIPDLCFNSTEEELNKTKNAQLAIFTVSYINWVIWQTRHKIEPIFFLGNSLGQVTAGAAAGAYSFEDGLLIVKKRGELMEKECLNNPGKLFAIAVRPQPDVFPNELDPRLKEIILQFEKRRIYLEAINSPGQIVAGCEMKYLEDTYRWLESIKDLKKVELKAQGVFHSPLMFDAVGEFAEFIYGRDIKIKSPSRPIIDNTTVQPLTTAAEIKLSLLKHLHKPVRWMETLNFLEKEGVDGTIEPGGNVLTNLNKHRTLIGTSAVAVGATAAVAIFLSKHGKKEGEENKDNKE